MARATGRTVALEGKDRAEGGQSWPMAPKKKGEAARHKVQVQGPPETLQDVGVEAWPRRGSWQECR